MDPFGYIWNTLLVGTLESSLIALATLTGSAGVAIVLFTLIIKLITFPLTWKQLKSARAMSELQPHLREIQRKYGKDRQRLTEETMRLYKEHGVNPAMGCLPMLVQMPIWIALYYALLNLAHNPSVPAFQAPFLWLSSLGKPDPLGVQLFNFFLPIPLLPILTAATQWVVQRMMTMPTQDPQQQMMSQMMQFMPIMFLVISISMPSGLVLYWLASNVFTIVQQYFTTGWGSLLPARAAANGTTPSQPASSTSSNDAESPSDGAATSRSARKRSRAAGKSSRERRSGGKR